MNFLILIGIILISMLSGCQESRKSQMGTVVDPNVSQVALVNASVFPKEMVGIWQNKENGWIFRIEKSGRIFKVQHTIGRAELRAGEISTFPLANNGKGIIKPGSWYVQYNGETQTVAIEITLERFQYNLGYGDMVSGSSRDIFIGELPEKGQTIWKAQWLSYPKYVASTGDKQYTNYTLPFEAGDEDKGEIVFEKIDLKSSERNP